ncbi:cytochrome c oxidase subunit 3, partial [Burkholderia sola]|uniref:cytochrome c oxidase subunit 3 n=1 Tax=Burkholderia sola TaxID=2843302 RepID=UPI0023DE135D
STHERVLAELWESEPGWRGWLGTVDHKRIGLRYIVTAFVFLLLGGVEALVMRIQLARPNATVLTPAQYDSLFTMHGVTMIFLYALPVLSGFANYLWPANTVVLLSSSVFVWLAERAVRAEKQARAVALLVVALVLGTAFALVQLHEWRDHPYGPTAHLYGSLYFTITGFHLAHVVAGLAILALLAGWTAAGFFGRERRVALTVGGLYWHFVDVVWLFIFTARCRAGRAALGARRRVARADRRGRVRAGRRLRDVARARVAASARCPRTRRDARRQYALSRALRDARRARLRDRSGVHGDRHRFRGALQSMALISFASPPGRWRRSISGNCFRARRPRSSAGC